MKTGSDSAPWILGVAALALALSVFALLRDPVPSDGGGSDVMDLARRVEDLEATTSRLGDAGSATPPAPPSPGASPAATAELAARLTRLEDALRRMPRTGPPAAGNRSPEAPAPSPPRELGEPPRPVAASLGELQARAMDGSSSEQDRVAALTALRMTAGGRSREVVLSMLDLARESRDAAIRADVFRQLNGVVEPELRDALVEALRRDEAVKVREEAAETLGSFRDDPTARDALQDAKENDADEGVRKQAQKALAGGR